MSYFYLIVDTLVAVCLLTLTFSVAKRLVGVRTRSKLLGYDLFFSWLMSYETTPPLLVGLTGLTATALVWMNLLFAGFMELLCGMYLTMLLVRLYYRKPNLDSQSVRF